MLKSDKSPFEKILNFYRFMVKPHRTDIRMTYEDIQVKYGWHTSTDEWHTDDIRVTYERHTDDIRIYTSDIRMTYEYIRVTYGWHTSTYDWHTDDIQVHVLDIQITCVLKETLFKIFLIILFQNIDL